MAIQRKGNYKWIPHHQVYVVRALKNLKKKCRQSRQSRQEFMPTLPTLPTNLYMFADNEIVSNLIRTKKPNFYFKDWMKNMMISEPCHNISLRRCTCTNSNKNCILYIRQCLYRSVYISTYMTGSCGVEVVSKYIVILSLWVVSTPIYVVEVLDDDNIC